VYQYTQYRGKFFTLCSLENNLKITLKSSLEEQYENLTLNGSDVSNVLRKEQHNKNVGKNCNN